MVYARDLKSLGQFVYAGSIPAHGTTITTRELLLGLAKLNYFIKENRFSIRYSLQINKCTCSGCKIIPQESLGHCWIDEKIIKVQPIINEISIFTLCHELSHGIFNLRYKDKIHCCEFHLEELVWTKAIDLWSLFISNKISPKTLEVAQNCLNLYSHLKETCYKK